MMQQQRTRDDRSLGELFGELSRETTTLVRQEITLAKVELTQKATQVGKDVGFLAVGGAVAYAGFLALVAAVVFLINLAINIMWLSALIVAVVVMVVGYLLIRSGLENLKHGGLAPTQTIESIKEDAQWAKEQAR